MQVLVVELEAVTLSRGAKEGGRGRGVAPRGPPLPLCLPSIFMLAVFVLLSPSESTCPDCNVNAERGEGAIFA